MTDQGLVTPKRTLRSVEVFERKRCCSGRAIGRRVGSKLPLTQRLIAARPRVNLRGNGQLTRSPRCGGNSNLSLSELLLQLRVLGFGFFRDGDAGIGVFYKAVRNFRVARHWLGRSAP
jgi:hypothetical protein